MATFPNITMLNYLIPILGVLSLGGFIIKLIEFIYIYFLCPAALQRFQHSRKNSGSSNKQETKAWALVTGASDGIGFQIAIELARSGFNIVLHGRNPTKLSDKLNHIRSKFPKIGARTLVADASDQKGMEKRIAEIAQEMDSLPGPLTILVNNAGGLPNTTGQDWMTFGEQPADDIDKTIDLNLRFPTLLTRALIPSMKKDAPGLIMVVGSGAGDINPPYLTIYGGAKAYLRCWTQALGAELQLEGHDIEILGLNVAKVTETNGIRESVSFLVPSANTMAKSMLARVGCGKMWVWGHWTHAMQAAILYRLPDPLMRWAVAGMMKSVRDQVVKTKTT